MWRSGASPGCDDRVHDSPGLFDLVASSKQSRIAKHDIEQEALISVWKFFTTGIETKIQLAQSQSHIEVGDFGLEVQLKAFGGLDLDDQSVGLGAVGFLLAKEQVGWLTELDHDLGGPAAHGFSAPKVERDAAPSPVVDIEFKRSERFGGAPLWHPLFIEVALVLPADTEFGEVAAVVRPDSLEDFHLFVSNEFPCVANRGFHGRDHHELEQVVLEHVPKHSRFVIVSTPTTYLDLLGHGDLDMVDVVSVPNRFEDRVSKAKHEDVLDRFLSKVVIDSVDLVFAKGLVDRLIETLGRSKVGTEGFFDDHSPMA